MAFVNINNYIVKVFWISQRAEVERITDVSDKFSAFFKVAETSSLIFSVSRPSIQSLDLAEESVRTRAHFHRCKVR